MLFAVYVTEWKKHARFRVSEGWSLCVAQVLRDHIQPHLDRVPLKKITVVHISKVIQASKDRGHSEAQQKKIYMVMSKLFRDAVEFFEYLDRSPVKKRYHLVKVNPISQPYMTWEQSVIMLEYALDSQLFMLPVWIQLLSGLRVSEVQVLTWDCVDFDRDLIHVRRAYNKLTKAIQPYPKNRSHYPVPIPPKLRARLLGEKNRVGLVCRNQSGGMMSENGYREYLNRVCTKLKLPIRSSHGLRHSCARIYQEMGAGDEDIQRLLGHKWLVSTKTYLHRDDVRLVEVAKRIA